MKPTRRISVLLAEDHTIVREGLLKLLQIDNRIQVVGEADNGRKAVGMTTRLKPDIVIMDIAMPELNGVEATRQIRETSPETKVLILSAHSDEVYIEQLMELGARGYLVKQDSARHLHDAILEIHQGNRYFSPSLKKAIARKEKRTLDRKGRVQVKTIRLTPREMEVLQLVAEGSANKQIAGILDISIKTVEKHRDHLMHKLNIHETASLTRYAIETGIIECSIQPTC